MDKSRRIRRTLRKKRRTQRQKKQYKSRAGPSSRVNNREKSHIVRVFLGVLNMVKLYHWKTQSYASHKATDELYKNLNENIDTFVEILLGKDESRVTLLEKKGEVIDAKDKHDFKQHIYEFREFLIRDINMHFDSKQDSDLLNVRDEILGNINQFLYLMTFDK
jgi:DNA-binding ferritin-like protein